MLNIPLKEYVTGRILPSIQTPAQYIGGELNSVRKDHAEARGTLCLAFPDTYSLGMSHHGLQVLYSLMNAREDWACERVFTPLHDFEAALREHELPALLARNLHAAEPARRRRLLAPVRDRLLERPDDARPRRDPAPRRRPDGRATPWSSPAAPGRRTPSLLAPFIDLFVIGDGEPSLPIVCDMWAEMKGTTRP